MHSGPELTAVFIVCLTLLVGAAMRTVSSRIHVPYTIAMLVFGLFVGFILKFFDGFSSGNPLRMIESGAYVTPELILFVFLPVLVFESAFRVHLHTFRKNAAAVATLAVPGMVGSALLVACGMVGLSAIGGWHWGWPEALVFGALISATDPVAVVAMLRETGAPKRLGLLIEGESLFNDGTAIVLFTVFLGWLTGSQILAAGDTAVYFLAVTIGGASVGLILALVVSVWLSRSFNAPLVEITLTLVLAYLAMFVADNLFHVSGVIAVVCAGLWMSGRGRLQISPEVSRFLQRFWEMLCYLANTLIFFLVGLVIATQVRDAVLIDLGITLLAFILVLAVRMIVTFLLRPMMNPLSDRPDSRETMVVAWSGLRGAVSLALALMVSQHPAIPPEIGRQVLLITAGVVLLTILVNGTSTPWLLRRLGFTGRPASQRLADLTAAVSVLNRVGQEIAEVSRTRDLRTVNWRDVERDLEGRRRELESNIENTRLELEASAPDVRDLGYWRQLLHLERQAYWTAFRQGTLSSRATRILDHEIDIELDRLASGADPAGDRAAGRSVWWAPLARWLERADRGFGRLQFELVALRYELFRGRQLAAEHVLANLGARGPSHSEVRQLMERVQRKNLHAAKQSLEDLRANLPEVTGAIETRLARRIQLNFERDQVRLLASSGTIDSSSADEALASIERRMKLIHRSARSVALPKIGELCREAPLFAGLDDAAMDLLGTITVEQVLAPGEVLFRQGDSGDGLFVIARGALAVVREHHDADDELLDILGGGDILGEMALLTGEPRMATARAQTTVVVGEISKPDFECLLEREPQMGKSVWSSFGERRFDTALRKVKDYQHLDHDDRLTWFRSGTMSKLARGDIIKDGKYRYAFVVTGELNDGSGNYPPDSLTAIPGDGKLVAASAARVALLPSLASRDLGPKAKGQNKRLSR